MYGFGKNEEILAAIYIQDFHIKVVVGFKFPFTFYNQTCLFYFFTSKIRIDCIRNLESRPIIVNCKQKLAFTQKRIYTLQSPLCLHYPHIGLLFFTLYILILDCQSSQKYTNAKNKISSNIIVASNYHIIMFKSS